MNVGFEFLKNRGFKADTIKAFDIMYYDGAAIHSCPSTKDKGLCDTIRPLLKDSFANSVILPVYDTYGVLVAASARRLDYPNTKPKFDSSVFNKRDVVYGLNLTYKEVLDKDAIFITEGPFDFLMLWQYGAKNGASSLGCSMAFNQINQCMRFTNNFYIIYDNDDRGREGAVKTYKSLKSYNCNCKIIQLSCDLDEYLQKYGLEEFLKHA
jgi:DNA primase